MVFGLGFFRYFFSLAAGEVVALQDLNRRRLQTLSLFFFLIACIILGLYLVLFTFLLSAFIFFFLLFGQIVSLIEIKFNLTFLWHVEIVRLNT